MLRLFFVLCPLVFVSCSACAQPLIHSVKWLKPAASLPASAKHLVDSGVYKALDTVLQGDRFEYWQDDENGQFFLLLPRRTNDAPAAVRITLSDEKGDKITEAATEAGKSNRLSFLIAMPGLKPGQYLLRAAYADDPAQAAQYSFTKIDKRHAIVPIPPDGIPIRLEKQKHVPNATWPVRLGVPLPRGAVTDASRLGLFENGRPVPANVKTIATWSPQGSAQWVHLDFLGRYTGGKAAEYRLKLLPQAASAPATPLQVNQTDDEIVVNTGTIRFIVNRKQFKGVEKAWFDASGTGHFDEAKPVVQDSQGPYLVDQRRIRFDASRDKNVQVVVEEQNAVRVTIRATGWYVNGEGRVPPLCQFITRIYAYAGQPMLRISQRTIITYDTRTNRLADLGFHIGSTMGESFRLGADGTVKNGDLPKAPQTTFLHHDRWNHFRIVGANDNEIEGQKSDGWFSLVAGDKSTLSVMLRDIWQKFPKEVEMSRAGLTLHFWPKHGHRAFSREAELDIKNIYKFWCFHQGAMLNLNLPDDYYAALAGPYASETRECRPEHALNGNGQGLAIGNEFALVFSTPQQAESLPGLARMYQDDPTALATPEWNCATGALGEIAPVDKKNFPAMEDAVEKGYLSWMANLDRGQAYGMWNYADSHTYWDADRNRANLHRVWQNSHYHQMGTTWLMYFRSGSGELLRWARPSTDNFMNVGTINYVDPETPIKFHALGAMYHCKGLTPWGSEAFGMARHDTHAGVAGHWIDPDAFLWDWYLTGNERARDVYDMWAATFGDDLLYKGTRRETNTTLACEMNLYRQSWDAALLPSIRGMGVSLRTHEPLEKQNPGAMWHPLWITRYYEQMRDPDYVPFILKYAKGTNLSDTWTTALSALAYDLSGDRSYLTQHFEQIDDYPKRFFHKAGDAYDWFGDGPGPIGDRWGAYLSWGYLLHAFDQANVTSVAAHENTRFAYLTRASRIDIPAPPSLVVYVQEPKDRAFKMNFAAESLGGNLFPGKIVMHAPSGKEIFGHLVPPPEVHGRSAWREQNEIPADGVSGLYRIEYFTQEANVSAPFTDLPAEAMSLPKNAQLSTDNTYGLLMPSDTHPVKLTINSGGRSGSIHPCNVNVADADGHVIATASMFNPLEMPPLVVTLDPQQHKLPWKLDIYGPATVAWEGESQYLLMGSSQTALTIVRDALNRQ
jgi:hypothetical protein